MKAAVWIDWGKLEIRDMPEPEPRNGWVKIKVMSAGVCVTDTHVYSGKFRYGEPPGVLGHEIAGIVYEVGKGCSGKFKLGDRVVVETSIGCGVCRQCVEGRRHLCAHMTEIGFPPHGGGYAQYVCAPEENLFSLPDKLSFDEGAILESNACPIGSLYSLGIRFGCTVSVIGVGVAGLAFIQGAKAMGAGRVIAIARDVQKLKRATDFGADYLVVMSESTVCDVNDLGGCELVCEAAGAPETIDLATELPEIGGRVILYGIPGNDAKVSFPVAKIITRQLEIHGVMANPDVWEPLLRMVENGKIRLAPLVTHRFSLTDIAKAFALVESGEKSLLKAVVHPWE